MRHLQPESDAGMEKLGHLRCIGAFFSLKFRAVEEPFSLIACFHALAISHDFLYAVGL